MAGRSEVRYFYAPLVARTIQLARTLGRTSGAGSITSTPRAVKSTQEVATKDTGDGVSSWDFKLGWDTLGDVGPRLRVRGKPGKKKYYRPLG